ncbi:membrane protein insertion efficiency factor YidD [Patescibacteria group bacterium]|nr:membrane protein insertion efficiency factor YidD [Patescibacteria group bacterium]MBU3922887.1 membrane protein insertion efficiency factor YidD [Patescibacteria group bacterium]
MLKLYKKFISVIFQYFNPNYGCKFYPTCSEYCSQSIKKYGLIKGFLKSIKRIIKCNPFNKGGYDPC